MTPEFWSGRNVLVTGHTGFKGGWLSLWLQRLGAKVAGYSLPAPTRPSFFQTASVAQGMSHYEGDILDRENLRACMSQNAPEFVFHLAAQALVRIGYSEPIDTLGANVMGTANVLEAVRRMPSVKAVVVITSDKCYDNREWLWPYREDESLGGRDPYSASKACAEIVAAAWRDSFLAGQGTAGATARAGQRLRGRGMGPGPVGGGGPRARAGRRAL